jgi:predicted transcriptional regulator
MAARTPGGRRRSSGELETEVLAALWAADHPLTPREIRGTLGGDLAYNTIHTILTRLHDKQQVTRQARGAYRPTTTNAARSAARMRDVLSGDPDRAAVLQNFVSTLTPDEEQALRRFLDQTGPDDNRSTGS